MGNFTIIEATGFDFQKILSPLPHEDRNKLKHINWFAWDRFQEIIRSVSSSSKMHEISEIFVISKPNFGIEINTTEFERRYCSGIRSLLLEILSQIPQIEEYNFIRNHFFECQVSAELIANTVVTFYLARNRINFSTYPNSTQAGIYFQNIREANSKYDEYLVSKGNEFLLTIAKCDISGANDFCSAINALPSEVTLEFIENFVLTTGNYPVHFIDKWDLITYIREVKNISDPMQKIMHTLRIQEEIQKKLHTIISFNLEKLYIDLESYANTFLNSNKPQKMTKFRDFIQKIAILIEIRNQTSAQKISQMPSKLCKSTLENYSKANM